MNWLRRKRFRSFIRTSFWIWPAAVIVPTILVARTTQMLDKHLGWRVLGFSPDGARLLLGALSTSMLTFIVFVFSSMLLAVQLASNQLTPRIITLAYSRRSPKILATLLLATFLYSTILQGRIEDDYVPQLSAMLCAVIAAASIGVFTWFIQSFGNSLRPIAVLTRLSDEARPEIDAVFSQPFRDGISEQSGARRESLPEDSRSISYEGRSGVLMAYGKTELPAVAARFDCAVELMVQVGEFVSRGDVLFRVHPPGRVGMERDLLHCVAIGEEQTLEQDPAFAIRAVVDIASRSLSPGINDPSTAVAAIEQIHRLLRHIGSRQLESRVIRDEGGKLRFIVPVPRWEDLVCLGVTEIRLFGASSIQVARRLRAMLEHLIRVLPPARAPALQEELSLLEKAVLRAYPDDEDRRRASVADSLGVGGSPE